MGVCIADGTGAPDDVEQAQAEGFEFERVIWYKDANMRKLYFWVAILSVASATTGYDGAMLNASQLIDDWQEFFGHPIKERLGIMNNAFNIGSIACFFIVPHFTDWAGRKWPIAVGCVIMIAGGCLGAFSNTWGGQ